MLRSQRVWHQIAEHLPGLEAGQLEQGWAAAHNYGRSAIRTRLSQSCSCEHFSSGPQGGSADHGREPSAPEQPPSLMHRTATGAGAELRKLAAAARRSSWAKAFALHSSSAWQQHGHWFQLAAAAAAVYPLYMTGIAATSQLGYDPSTYSTHILAVSSAAVAAAGMQLHLRRSVNPDQVFNLAMRKLGRHAGLQEVMGGSLAGGDVRAYLLTAGGMYLKEGFLLRTRNRRIQMIFPLEGPAMKGVATVVAKKTHGKYAFRLLCVDLPEGTRVPFSKFADVARMPATPGSSSSSRSSNLGTPPSSSSSSSSGNLGTPPSSSSSSSSSGTGDTAAGSSEPAAAVVGAPASKPGGADMQQVARVFLIGSSKDYKQYRVLSELRDPLIAALQQQGEFFRVEDELEEDLGHYTSPAEDQDQVNSWDKLKKGGAFAWAAAQQLQQRVAGAVAACLQRARERSQIREAARLKQQQREQQQQQREQPPDAASAVQEQQQQPQPAAASEVSSSAGKAP